jgi:hypothetical protein
MICLHASLSSAFFCLRQAVIWSESGMNALQRRSTSGVQARRSSGAPCATAETGKTINDSQATRENAFNPSRIHLSPPIRKTPKQSRARQWCPDSVPTKPCRSLVSRRGRRILNSVAIPRTSLPRFIRTQAEDAPE